ncbi:MAG TPA: hypothetical protein VJJ23_00750 [Candidatus Nanoarchaeia archaeon]|nr:hypothetical protein [Candidatus Nanoarchaeia archaeon]
MTLDEILKPVKFIDEQITTIWYNKIGKKIPEEKLEKISDKIEQTSFSNFMVGYLFHDIPIIIANSSNPHPWYFICVPSGQAIGYALLFGSVLGISKGLREENLRNDSNIDIQNISFDRVRKISRAVRFPTLALGMYELGKSAIDLGDNILNKKPLNYESLSSLFLGTAYLGAALLHYMNDRDPKIKDKKPFYETLFEKVKDRLDSLVPSPLPVPVKANLEYRVD